MKLRVYEVGSDAATVTIEVSGTPIHLRHIRAHIYKTGSPSGNAVLQLADASDGTVLTSTAVSLASMSSVAYFHGFVQFEMSYALQADTQYKLILTSSGGYSYGASDFFGWAFAEGIPVVEIWEQKNLIRGT